MDDFCQVAVQVWRYIDNMEAVEIEYVDYVDESMLPDIRSLVSRDLSEPYSIYTYRYFLHGWPKLCICVYGVDPDIGERTMIATIVSKAEVEAGVMQGYIAMLAVDSRFRARGIGSSLVQKTIERMKEMGCEEIVLETEVGRCIALLYVISPHLCYQASNKKALSLYLRLGFFKEDKMSKYYLNGGDAYRLKYLISVPQRVSTIEGASLPTATESQPVQAN